MMLLAAFGQAESDGAGKTALMSVNRRIHEGRPPKQLHRRLGCSLNETGRLMPDSRSFEFELADGTVISIGL